jgi:integrase
MTRKTLTERGIAALKPKPGRYDAWDALVPGLAVRVSEAGHKSFVLVARYPGRKNPTRKAIADVGAITLAGAREQARAWLARIQQGIDPKLALARERQAAEAAAGNTFGAVAEKFITTELPKQRRGHVVERLLRKEVLPHWKGRPVGEITHRDVRELVLKIVDRGTRAYARNVLDAIRGAFAFAVDRGVIDVSPTAMIKPSRITGAKAIRTRTLTDIELRALWDAAGELGYPHGPLVRMLMLTGCRLNEVAGARWREFDLAGRLWRVPSERFKSNAQHVVPLCDDAMALLTGLPRWTRGDHVFSSTYGIKPVAAFSKMKTRVDEQMGGAIAGWTFHDIRRTVRTRLSELRVPEPIAELAIGHGRKGLLRIYDQSERLPEVREAMELWATKLRSIVTPPPNVVILRKTTAP